MKLSETICCRFLERAQPFSLEMEEWFENMAEATRAERVRIDLMGKKWMDHILKDQPKFYPQEMRGKVRLEDPMGELYIYAVTVRNGQSFGVLASNNIEAIRKVNDMYGAESQEITVLKVYSEPVVGWVGPAEDQFETHA